MQICVLRSRFLIKYVTLIKPNGQRLATEPFGSISDTYFLNEPIYKASYAESKLTENWLTYKTVRPLLVFLNVYPSGKTPHVPHWLSPYIRKAIGYHVNKPYCLAKVWTVCNVKCVAKQTNFIPYIVLLYIQDRVSLIYVCL